MQSMIDEYILKILSGKDLEKNEMKNAAMELTKGDYSPVVRGTFLSSLYLKGYSPDEITGFAEAIMSFSPISEFRQCSDIVGTGGDHKGTINVSTAASIVCSSLGIRMGKHGNRGITGKSGGADFMELCGYRFPGSRDEVMNGLINMNFSFILAPLHNPAFRVFGEVRKMLKHPTIFNLMGPLTNPLNPGIRVIGCTDSNIQETYSKSMLSSGTRGFVISSEEGMDEISYSGRSSLIQVGDDIRKFTVDAQQIIGRKIGDEETTGNEREDIFRKTLSGLNGTMRDASDFIAINAAPCILASGLEHTFDDAYRTAQRAITSGIAIEKLMNITGGKLKEAADAS